MLRQKILANTLINSGGKFLSFSLQLCIITYLIRTLGKEAYGMVVLALALVANSNILEAGFGLSVTKYVAEYRVTDNRMKLLHIVNTHLVISTVLGIIMCSVLIVINEVFLDKIFIIPPELASDAKNMIRPLIVLTLFEFWAVSLIRVSEGLQKFTLARGMELVKWLLRAVLVFISVTAGYGLPGIGFAFLAAGIIALAVVFYKVIIQDPGMHLSFRYCTRESFRELFGFSIWVFLTKLFAFLSYRIDVFLLSIFLPPANLTYYNVAFKIYEGITYGITLISSTLVPVASELDTASDRQRLTLLYERATKYTVLCISPFIVIAMVEMPRIMLLWMGEGFEVSILLARLFLIALIPMMLITSGAVLMVGMNRVRELVTYNAVATAVNFGISLYLVSSIGAEGVVIGTVSGSFVILVSYVMVMLGIFGIPLPVYIHRIILMPLVALTIMVSLVLFFPGIAGVLIGFTSYVIFTLYILVDSEDLKGFVVFMRSLIWH